MAVLDPIRRWAIPPFPWEVHMDQSKDDVLMGLAEFRNLTHLSPSGERNHRRDQDDWPPHVRIGRKIFYRRAAVMEWLQRQEAKQVSTR